MAKLTGQFTTPSLDSNNNKIHKPFLHGVVFVFIGATKVTRETDAKGKYSFDLANGEYEVSVYLKGNTEKDRFDMRAGEKFTVTTTTQADALEKWLQVIGTSGKDELATYYENLLAQMQKVSDDFKQNTQFVGNGKIMKEGAYNFGVRSPAARFEESSPTGFYLNDSGSTIRGTPHNTSIVQLLGNARRFIGLSEGAGELRYASYGGVAEGEFRTAYDDFNTRLDKNNVLHAGTATPVNTLKEGDFGLGSYISPDVRSPGVLFNSSKNGLYSHVTIKNEGMLQGASAYIVNNIDRANTGRKRKVVIGLESTNFNGVFKAPEMYLGGTDETGSFRFGWFKIWGQSNTAVDSNGFIKAASPIIKLFNDRIEHSGFGDNEPVFEKLSTGTYKISNTLGLAQEGWTYEKPRGNDGQPYFRIEVEKLEDGCIVRVHDEYDTVEKAEITDINGNTRAVDKIVKILGQARDIKEHERWIDLRFHEEPEEHQDEELLTEVNTEAL